MIDHLFLRKPLLDILELKSLQCHVEMFVPYTKGITLVPFCRCDEETPIQSKYQSMVTDQIFRREREMKAS